MTTNRKRTTKNPHKKPRDYKKEYARSGKKKIAQRSRTNAARKSLGLKKGDPREASHSGFGGTGSVKTESGTKNAKRQPKRKKK